MHHDAVYALLGLVAVPPEFPIDYSCKATTLDLDVIQHFTLSVVKTSRRPLVESISANISIVFNVIFKDQPWDISAMCYHCYQMKFDPRCDIVPLCDARRTANHFVWLARGLRGLEDRSWTGTGKNNRVTLHQKQVFCVTCRAHVYGLGFNCLWYTRLSDEVLLVSMKKLTDPEEVALLTASRSASEVWMSLPENLATYRNRFNQDLADQVRDELVVVNETTPWCAE